MPVLTNPKQRQKEAKKIIHGAAMKAGSLSFAGGVIPGGNLVLSVS